MRPLFVVVLLAVIAVVVLWLVLPARVLQRQRKIEDLD
jgi:predicted MFS family arabinose efflux permease